MDGRIVNSGSFPRRFANATGCSLCARSFRIPELSREELLDNLMTILTDTGVADADLFWYRLAIDEAIINAITHGHCENPENPYTPVRIDCAIDGLTVSVRISDQGFGFDPESIPNPTLDENLWNVTGRGIFLMRQAMDEVSWNEVGNSVLLVRQIKRNEISDLTDK